jgi:hypothetical protein
MFLFEAHDKSFVGKSVFRIAAAHIYEGVSQVWGEYTWS